MHLLAERLCGCLSFRLQCETAGQKFISHVTGHVIPIPQGQCEIVICWRGRELPPRRPSLTNNRRDGPLQHLVLLRGRFINFPLSGDEELDEVQLSSFMCLSEHNKPPRCCFLYLGIISMSLAEFYNVNPIWGLIVRI